MRTIKLLTAAIVLAAISPTSWAACTNSGSPLFIRQCLDTIERIQVVNSTSTIVVFPTADDEGAIGCSGGLTLTPSSQMFDQQYQLMLLATASFLTVDIDLPALSGCNILNVALQP